jgi:hypothetical protein
MLIYILILVILLVYFYHDYFRKSIEDDVDEWDDIMRNFYKYPDYDDFMVIWDNHKKMIAKVGKPIKFFIWGVYQTQPQFFNQEQLAILNSWMRDINRGLRRIQARDPTPELLDCIWSLYFATGDMKYPQIIAGVADGGYAPHIVEAAKWSYQSIMGRPWWRDLLVQVDEQTAEEPENAPAPAPAPETLADDNADVGVGVGVPPAT